MEVFKLFATLGLNAETFERDLKNIETRLDNTSRNFSAAGRTLTTSVTAPIVGVGVAALKSAIDFESAFAGVRKTVDATEEEFDQLEDGIRSMSARLPASANDIARVAEAAGQLGIKTQNILEFTEVMIGLGTATNMTAEEAATALARFANITQMPQEDFDRLGSVIVDLGNNLATTEGEITDMGLRIAGAGKQIGLTEAEVLGVAGALSSLGIMADAGGTAISRVMLTMMTEVMNGGEKLDAFAATAGMSADEFSDAFRNRPTEAITSFVNGLANISAEGGNVVSVLDSVSLNDIRVRDALLRMAGAGDVLTNSIGLATAAWDENNALQVEVGRRYETTESQLQMARNQMMEVVRTLGDALIPLFLQLLDASKPLIAAIQSLADWFAGLDPRMQTVIVTVTAVAAALGPILWFIGSFTGAVSNLLPILRLVPGAFAAIRGAIGLLSGPIGWIITAVGLIAAAWTTDFLGIRTFVTENWHYIGDAFGWARDRITEAWDAIKTATAAARDAIQSVLQALADYVGSIFGGIKHHFELLLDFWRAIFRGDLQGAFDAIQGMFQNWWDTLNTFLFGLPQKMLEFGKELIGGLINGVKSMLTGAVDAVKGVGQGVIDGFKGLLGIQSPSKVFHEFGENIGEGLADGIEASTPRAEAAMSALAGAVVKAGQVMLRGAWDPEDVVAGLTAGLEGKDAIRALQDRLGQLQGQRDSLITADMTARRVGNMFIDAQAKAIEDELRRLREELVRSRTASARESEVQTRRFAMAVTTFGNDIRSYTLSSQRY